MFAGNAKSLVARYIDKIFPRLWMERELKFRSHHFENELWLVPIFCDKRMTSIDVGANTGAYSYYMLKYSAHVISFEPNIDHWRRLRRLLGTRCHLESAALSNDSRHVKLRVDEHNDGLATIEERNSLTWAADESAVVCRDITSRTLDSFSLSNISLIKIDVEGHEEAVIEGASKTIALNRPVLIIESEDRHNPGAPRRLVETMAKFEYRAFFLRGGVLVSSENLEDKDINPANLDGGLRQYVNNFIFIPVDKIDKYAQVVLGISNKLAK